MDFQVYQSFSIDGSRIAKYTFRDGTRKFYGRGPAKKKKIDFLEFFY
jgi:hypothetical protein